MAAIDHNSHLGRAQATNQVGEARCHRTYRKRTKRWDAVPVLEEKLYTYMPSLIDALLLYRAECELNVRTPSSLLRRNDHPELISKTIAKRAPPATSEIMQTKKSRFTSDC